MAVRRVRRTIEERWAEWTWSIDQSLGWYERVTLTMLLLKRKPQGWLLMVKATKKGKPMVAFFEAPTIFRCWVLLGAAMSHHNIRWKPDRQPPELGD